MARAASVARIAQAFLDIRPHVRAELLAGLHPRQLHRKEIERAENLECLVGAAAIRGGVLGAREHVAEHAGLVCEHLRDVPFGGGEAKIGRQRDTQAGQVDRHRASEIRRAPDVTTEHRGCQWIARIVTDHGGEQQAGIRHRARHRPQDGKRAPSERAFFAWHQAGRRPEPDHPAKRRRVAQRAASIRAGCDRYHAGCQCDGRSAGGTGGGLRRIERIAGGAIDGVARVGARPRTPACWSFRR